ncbi:MAG: hypothetical protein QGF71_00085, partial [Rhodospirillales bacterium]|nr:hypothetical protein [Rhodospirillales bacterium]
MKRCLTRRETLKAGVLAGLGAAVSVTPLSGFAGTAAPIAVIDLRLRERRGFAIWCRNNGFEMIGISHDLDQVWLDLRARLRTAPVPVIGLTRPSAQMVFSDLGASCGLRTVFRGNHQTDAMNTIGHRFTGSQSSGDVFGRGLRNGADGWSA